MTFLLDCGEIFLILDAIQFSSAMGNSCHLVLVLFSLVLSNSTILFKFSSRIFLHSFVRAILFKLCTYDKQRIQKKNDRASEPAAHQRGLN
jgi:hypothetical protein